MPANNNVGDIPGKIDRVFDRLANQDLFDIDIMPEGHMLFIKNKDVPGVVGTIGTILGNNSVNIAGYVLGREEDVDTRAI